MCHCLMWAKATHQKKVANSKSPVFFFLNPLARSPHVKNSNHSKSLNAEKHMEQTGAVDSSSDQTTTENTAQRFAPRL